MATPSNFRDLRGLRFGRLRVISREFVKNGSVHWKCQCECGKETFVPTRRLNNGESKSCGCLKVELQTKHGHGKRQRTGEYRSWYAMLQRCNNINHKQYKDYGGRGIAVCDRWSSFEYFIVDMGSKPSEGHTLDRIDINGNYEPSNCRWADKTEQARNRRINNKLGTSGVYWDAERNVYVARIGVNRKNLFLGRYTCLEDAIEARKEAEQKYWKESS